MLTIRFDGRTIEVADTPGALTAYNELRSISNNIDAFVFIQNHTGQRCDGLIEWHLKKGYEIFDRLDASEAERQHQESLEARERGLEQILDSQGVQ